MSTNSRVKVKCSKCSAMFSLRPTRTKDLTDRTLCYKCQPKALNPNKKAVEPKRKPQGMRA